ncbi:hypothetical protein ACFL9U_05570, partial [Thermodesulfobacteriota bacterium]
MMRRACLIIFIFAWLGLAGQGLATTPPQVPQDSNGGGEESAQTDSIRLPEKYTSEQIDAIMARLGDDQVRRLLIEELRKSALDTGEKAAIDEDDGLVTEALEEVEEAENLTRKRFVAVATNVKNIPADIRNALNRLSEDKGITHLLLLTAIMVAIFFAGWGIELLFGRLTVNFRKRIESAPTMHGFLKLWSILLKTIPDLLGIAVFALCCLFILFLLSGIAGGLPPLLLITYLSAIVASRLITVFSQMVCSPNVPALRVLPISDQSADYLHRHIVLLMRIFAFGLLTCAMFDRLEVNPDSFISMIILIGTILVFMIGGMIWKSRNQVSAAIFKDDAPESESRSWLLQQFVGIWHILALIYVFFVWVIWAGRLIIVGPKFDGAFIISFLIIPIYLVLDQLGQWVVSATIGTTHEKSEAEIDAEKIPDKYPRFARKIVRLIIIFALGLWLFDIWGFRLPYARDIANATFDILITLILAHIVWELINRTISRKLMESTPVAGESEDGEDNEWGAQAMDRSHTLLPLIRKFVGSALVVMVMLIVLSSMG